MLALEIQINSCESLFISASNLVKFDLMYGNPNQDRDLLAAFGADYAYRYTWLYGRAEIGDKIMLRLVDVEEDKISPPLETRKKDRELLKRDYENLKTELTEKHLI